MILLWKVARHHTFEECVEMLVQVRMLSRIGEGVALGSERPKASAMSMSTGCRAAGRVERKSWASVAVLQQRHDEPYVYVWASLPAGYQGEHAEVFALDVDVQPVWQLIEFVTIVVLGRV